MKHVPLPTQPLYTLRYDKCGECEGTGFNYGFMTARGEAIDGDWIEVNCDNGCDRGWFPRTCECCSQVSDLDDFNLCRECSEPLTTCVGDPLPPVSGECRFASPRHSGSAPSRAAPSRPSGECRLSRGEP